MKAAGLVVLLSFGLAAPASAECRTAADYAFGCALPKPMPHATRAFPSLEQAQLAYMQLPSIQYFPQKGVPTTPKTYPVPSFNEAVVSLGLSAQDAIALRTRIIRWNDAVRSGNYTATVHCVGDGDCAYMLSNSTHEQLIVVDTKDGQTYWKCSSWFSNDTNSRPGDRTCYTSFPGTGSFGLLEYLSRDGKFHVIAERFVSSGMSATQEEMIRWAEHERSFESNSR